MQNFDTDIPEYKSGILAYTTYESEIGDIRTNSPRHAVNSAYNVGLTGREFKQVNYSAYQYHSIWYNSRIAMIRFHDGENLYIGRECLTRNLLSFDEACELAYWTNSANGAHIVTKFEDGRTIESWLTDTGKKNTDGMVKIKVTVNKHYKRNRRSNW